MLLFDEDDDEDDIGEEVDEGDDVDNSQIDPTPAAAVPSMGRRLLLKRRNKQTTTPTPTLSTPLSSQATPISTTPIPSTPRPSQATPMATGRSIGIDLGTTFSAVSVIEAGRPVIIPINGQRIVPSVVAYTRTGVLVGEMARRQYVVNTANSFASVKRIIGRTVKEVKAAGEKLSAYKIDNKRSLETGKYDKYKGKGKGGKSKGGKGGGLTDTECELVCPNLDHAISPEDVSAEVLKTLVR